MAPPKERKVIQITSWQPTAYEDQRCYLVVLCDDGTLWRKSQPDGGWLEITPPARYGARHD